MELERVRARLRAHTPRQGSALTSAVRQAAVAAVLREVPGGEAQVLLIRRAEHPRDPWSGHMAFPGGRVDATDADAYAAAVRETWEEVGLSLERDAERLGGLSPLEAVARGRRLPLVVVPYVFALRDPAAGERLVPNAREVAETVWVPLRYVLEAAHRGTMRWTYEGTELELPCCRWEGRVIWGLTLRMLDDLGEVLR